MALQKTLARCLLQGRGRPVITHEYFHASLAMAHHQRNKGNEKRKREKTKTRLRGVALMILAPLEH